MKKLKEFGYNLKWLAIRMICIILCRRVMVHEKFLKTMNDHLRTGYQRYKERSFKYEGTIRYIHNRPYICLGNGWFIYLNASKHIEKFFNTSEIKLK